MLHGCVSLVPQAGVPRAGADHQGVHAGGDHHRPALAGGVRAGLLPSRRPDAPQPAEAAAETGAALQPLRGAQRLEDLPRVQAPLTVWWTGRPYWANWEERPRHFIWLFGQTWMIRFNLHLFVF